MSYIWDDASILHFWYDTQHDLFEMISNQTIYANMPLNMITFVLWPLMVYYDIQHVQFGMTFNNTHLVWHSMYPIRYDI